MSTDFADRVVVITGCSSGIGHATASAFLEGGALVVGIDLNSPPASLTQDRNFTFQKGDVSNEKTTEAVAASALLSHERIDVLINNAGIEYNNLGNILDMPMQEAKRIVDVNLWGYVNCARAFIPLIREGGAVVNVSSIQGIGAHRPGTTYQATKSAILGLTHALALECADRGIRVNSVLPGAIATEGAGQARAESKGVLDSYRRRILLRRRGRPEEVASTILFLCSPAASYITGTGLVVDGGYLANITPDFREHTDYVSNDPDL